MNFIENWLGYAPDAGDGTFELIIISVAVAVIMLGALRYFTERPRWRGRSTAH